MQGSISKATVFAEANKGRGVCHVPPLLKVKDDYSRINSIIIGGKKKVLIYLITQFLSLDYQSREGQLRESVRNPERY